MTCCTGTGADTRVSVNGKPLHEPYLKSPEASRGFAEASYDVRVPGGRLFLLGDHHANARDSRAFLDDEGGTLPGSAVRGRALEDFTVPAGLGTAMLLGVLLVLVGVGLGVAAVAIRRKARAMIPPPWTVV